MYLAEVWGPEAPEIKQALDGILSDADAHAAAAASMSGAGPQPVLA